MVKNVSAIRQVKNVFRLIKIGDGRTTEELVRDGKYNYANSDINSTNFPVRPTRCGVREIVLLKFDREVTSKEAIAEAKKQGLKRPTYEDALYFGVEHPEVQRERPAVFLHKPWLDDSHGHQSVLFLWGSAGGRELFPLFSVYGWSRYYHFAFVRK